MSSRLPLGKNELAVGEMPNFKLGILLDYNFGNFTIGSSGTMYLDPGTIGHKIGEDRMRYTEPIGNDEYHSNISPNIASYMWRRTA